jgi:hypothetical protein
MSEGIASECTVPSTIQSARIWMFNDALRPKIGVRQVIKCRLHSSWEPDRAGPRDERQGKEVSE